MRHVFAFAAFTAFAGLCTAAHAQFTLLPGQIEFRVVADNTVVTGLGDNVVRMAMQVRYVGGDFRAASLQATRGRIDSNEPVGGGTLNRSLVRSAPWGNNDFGTAVQTGMTAGHRELFQGGPGNNAPQNGGPGPFLGADGNVGFQGLHAFDNATTGVGRTDASGDGLLISVGLVDDTDGVGGDDSGVEPTAALIDTDYARWDTFFLFEYTVSDFTPRLISFDYQPIGSAAFPGVRRLQHRARHLP